MESSAETLSATAAGLDRQLHLCVLMVEDDEADAYLIGRALADNAMVATVVRAHDGNEAMAMVETGEVSPDVALIDLHMPGMNGFDLLLALSARPKLPFPMVVVTSSSSPSDAIRSRLRSAMRVVIKPDTVAELYAVLNTAIEAVCRPGANADNERPGKTPAYELMKSRTASVRRPAGDARQG